MIPTKEPRMEWVDIIAAAFIYLGFLMFLIALHLLTISTVGNVSSVLNTVFKVFVTIYSTTVIFGLIGLFVQLMRWVTWQVITPAWQKKKEREYHG